MSWLKPMEAARTLNDTLWRTPLSDLSGLARIAMHWVRIGYMLARELSSGDLTLRAASLVFTTILSLVPLLAVSFSLLKGFGVHNRMEQLLYNLLAPLGDKGAELAGRIVAFVDNVNVGVLGGVGLVILLFTVLSLIQKIEAALNHTWRVRRMRRFTERLTGYLSVLVVGPLLVFTALGVIGSVMRHELVQSAATFEPIGVAVSLVPKIIPYVLMFGAFTFVYLFIPNTRVRPASAAVGGLVAGALWASVGWGFASFVVSSPESNYTAIYSSFAIVFFFILWLYIAWLIVLTGGTVAFYFQHPEYLGVMPGELHASNRLRERIALAVMVRVARAHLEGAPAPDALRLARSMGLPAILVEETVEGLASAGLVAELAEPASGLLPARDADCIALADVLSAVRSARERRRLAPGWLPREPEAEQLMCELEEGASELLAGRTLGGLVRGEPRSAELGASVKRFG